MTAQHTPRYEPEPDDLDELDHGDDFLGERCAPRSSIPSDVERFTIGERAASAGAGANGHLGAVQVVIGPHHPGVESLTAAEAKKRGYYVDESPLYVHRVEPMTSGVPVTSGPTPDGTERAHDTQRFYERHSDIYGAEDAAVALTKLRDQVFALERQLSAEQVKVVDLVFADVTRRESLRKAENEVAALNDNIRSTHERCTELTEVVRASRAFTAIDGRMAHDIRERLIWQLIQLGAVVARSLENDPEPMNTASIAMGLVIMQAADGANEDQRRKLALEIAASALRRGFGE